MKVKIKKLHPNAIIPSYAKEGDGGLDLTCISRDVDLDYNLSYGTGLAFEIPEGYVGLLFPRSSNSKKDLICSNSVGVIDSGYRGEVKIKFKPIGTNSRFDKNNSLYCKDLNRLYNVGDRIGQLIIIPYPKIEFEEVEELSSTERGTGSYGSTGS